MAKTVRARYEGGVLKPLERLDLREGEEVIIRIEGRETVQGLASLIESLRKETPKVDDPMEILKEIRE